MRILRLVVAIVVAALAAVPAAAAVKVAKRDIDLKTKAYEIALEYPVTGVKAIDDVLARFAKERVAEYKDSSSEHEKDENPYSFDVNFTVERNDGKVFAVLFAESTYTGGAHPNGFFYSFNFLMPDGAQVFLPEILDGKRGIARISEYARADLNKQMNGPDSMSDDDWIARGAGPLATNFDVFILKPKSIFIEFPSYQVAAYAAGPQEVEVPLSALKGFTRADWRAPQPSFACGKAKTTIEKTICGDALLARMDRQSAELYAERLANAYEQSEKDKWKKTQREWLASRDATCAMTEPAECLRKSYATRLAALKKYTP